MKRFIAGASLLLLLLGLCGCGDYVSLMPGGPSLEEESIAAFETAPVSELLGWDGFMSSYYDDTPVALAYQGAAGYYSPRYDRETVIRACDALRGMTAVERLEDMPEGEEQVFRFTMSNGSTREIRFVGGVLVCAAGNYAVTGGEALWELSFPGYDGGFDVFSLYNDEKLTAFAASFDSDTPVSVGRRTNGGATLSNEDPDTVREVFELFADAEIESVETNPDQNIDLNTVQDYVFTMEDGSTRSFTLTGGCLTVTVNEAYGTVYYRISTGAQLQAMTIAAKTNAAGFEGGTLDMLRTDIARAVAVANGEYVEANPQLENSQESREEEDSEESEEETESTGLSVAGVYITFLMDGEEDYVSLQGDDARDFVQLLGEMEVSSEKPETAPDGYTVMVSVNLSDWSGPIIYFADNAVQQTVGTWYKVDESDYSAMTDRMMELYWAQVDDRTVEGTGGDEEAE